jgi:hypothetical protein
MEIALPEFLSDDLGACFRVQESMADYLANKFLGAAVFGLGTSLGADESLGPFFTKQGQKLKVALTAVIEPCNDVVDRLVSTLSGNEHGELAGNFILFRDGEGAVLAANPFFGKLDRDHGILAPEICAIFTLINYGTISTLKQEDSCEYL